VFNGETLYASTHEVGISINLETPFKAVVDGKRLKNIVDTFMGKELTVTLDEGTLKLECGGAVATVQTCNIEEQASLMPEVDLKNSRVYSISSDDSALLSALIKKTVYLAGSDDPRPAVHFVYLINVGDETVAYSSDAKSAMRAIYKGKKFFGQNIALNNFFAEVLTDYLEKGPVIFKLHNDCIQAEISGKGILIQGATGRTEENIIEFQGIIDGIINEAKALPTATAPTGLPAIIDQVLVVADDKISPSVNVKIKDKKLVASAESEGVASIKSPPIDCELDDFEVQIDPRVVKLFYSQNLLPNQIAIGESRVGFFDSNEHSESIFVSAVMR